MGIWTPRLPLDWTVRKLIPFRHYFFLKKKERDRKVHKKTRSAKLVEVGIWTPRLPLDWTVRKLIPLRHYFFLKKKERDRKVHKKTRSAKLVGSFTI